MVQQTRAPKAFWISTTWEQKSLLTFGRMSTDAFLQFLVKRSSNARGSNQRGTKLWPPQKERWLLFRCTSTGTLLRRRRTQVEVELEVALQLKPRNHHNQWS